MKPVNSSSQTNPYKHLEESVKEQVLSRKLNPRHVVVHLEDRVQRQREHEQFVCCARRMFGLVFSAGIMYTSYMVSPSFCHEFKCPENASTEDSFINAIRTVGSLGLVLSGFCCALASCTAEMYPRDN